MLNVESPTRLSWTTTSLTLTFYLSLSSPQLEREVTCYSFANCYSSATAFKVSLSFRLAMSIYDKDQDVCIFKKKFKHLTWFLIRRIVYIQKNYIKPPLLGKRRGVHCPCRAVLGRKCWCSLHAGSLMWSQGQEVAWPGVALHKNHVMLRVQ